ncbi:hypothetical protein EVAR_29849_1 [Eumeta japonica]|uniref:Uncharacterized protein n=1 Tax=Eumeta variegata TaxID=151549 RepID=A0A4C1VU54_EUMVA|nr:hypothetical protein EVAR_29849_1 [Eumeta japonica]
MPLSSGGARRRRRRRPPTASRLKGPRKQKSFAYKLLKRGLANLMSPTSTSGVAPPLPLSELNQIEMGQSARERDLSRRTRIKGADGSKEAGADTIIELLLMFTTLWYVNRLDIVLSVRLDAPLFRASNAVERL